MFPFCVVLRYFVLKVRRCHLHSLKVRYLTWLSCLTCTPTCRAIWSRLDYTRVRIKRRRYTMTVVDVICIIPHRWWRSSAAVSPADRSATASRHLPLLSWPCSPSSRCCWSTVPCVCTSGLWRTRTRVDSTVGRFTTTATQTGDRPHRTQSQSRRTSGSLQRHTQTHARAHRVDCRIHLVAHSDPHRELLARCSISWIRFRIHNVTAISDSAKSPFYSRI